MGAQPAGRQHVYPTVCFIFGHGRVLKYFFLFPCVAGGGPDGASLDGAGLQHVLHKGVFILPLERSLGGKRPVVEEGTVQVEYAGNNGLVCGMQHPVGTDSGDGRVGSVIMTLGLVDTHSSPMPMLKVWLQRFGIRIAARRFATADHAHGHVGLYGIGSEAALQDIQARLPCTPPIPLTRHPAARFDYPTYLNCLANDSDDAFGRVVMHAACTASTQTTLQGLRPVQQESMPACLKGGLVFVADHQLRPRPW